MSHSIPIIDLENDDLPLSIKNACENIGFFYIKNHGISDDIINQVKKATQDFFDLPLEEKNKIHINKSKCHRGYVPIKEELLDAQGDQKECLDLGIDKEIVTRLEGPNQWPQSIDSFQDTIQQYQNELIKLAKRLLQGFAESLGLDKLYFEDKVNDPLAFFRLLHYPCQGKDPGNQTQIGCGEHTDYGFLTILHQDNVGGLEVYNGKEWINAVPIEGTFIINIGDMMEILTKGQYRATIHRVFNRTDKDRYSMVLFFNPNHDFKIDERTSSQYLEGRFNSTFVYRGKLDDT